MTNADRVLHYLKSKSPAAATNSDVRSGTRISHHSTVYQETQILIAKGEIEGRQRGRIWEFWMENND